MEALIKAGKQGLSHNSEMQSIQLNTGTITSHHTSDENLMDLDSGESTLVEKTSQNDVNGDQSGGFNFRHLEKIRKGLSLSLDEFCGLFDVSRVTYSGRIRGANIRKKNYHKIVDIFEKLQAFINSEHINKEFYKMQESENKSEYLLKLFKRLYG